MLYRISALTLVVATAALAQAEPPDKLLSLVGQCEAQARRLADTLKTCRARGHDIAMPDAALAVAELFCRYSRVDAKQKDMRAAALASMRYVARMLEETQHQADEVLAGRLDWPAIPQWNTVGVTWHDGGFWVGQEPVFLTGMNWDASLADEQPELARRLGINLVDSMLRGTERPDGSLDLSEFTHHYGPFLQRMQEEGFAVDSLLDVSPPQWMIKSTPGMRRPGYGHYDNYVFEHPRAVAFRKNLLDHLIPLAAKYRSLFAIDLANEPAYQQPSDLMLAAWRTWLKRKYGNVAALNRAWGTHLHAINEVRTYPSEVPSSTDPWTRAVVDFSKPGVRGAHYDWCAFNNERVSAYFRSIAERIRSHAPNVAIHVKVMMGLYFTGSTERRGWPMKLTYHTFGVDPEAIAKFSSLLGCDLSLTDLEHVEKPNRFCGSVPYVIDWLNAGMSEDFLESLAPDKPLYNSEFHALEQVDAEHAKASAGKHIETALWLASLHGMSANLLWFWGRNNDGTVKDQARRWFEGSLLQQPWALQAYCQTSLELRRFVSSVRAFARQPRPVRLLYSEPSAIQDVAYMDCLRDAYEALNFLGVPIGFLTERQLANGIPADTKLVIVPNAKYVADNTVAALASARSHGVAVRVIGPESLTCEPTGRRRPKAQIPSFTTIPLGTPQEYHPVFNRWLTNAGVSRELLAVGADGKPAWGIEVRTARDGHKRLAYLVNELREPVTVHLRWAAKGAKFTDWRTNSQVGRQITLQPRQVVFGPYRAP